MADNNVMDSLVALCKRRGFVYPASEIYGGINGFWDYGPLGVQLKNNIRDHWWRRMVECPPMGPDGHPLQIVGLDSAIIQNPRTWEASGHVAGFNDPMVDCKECKARFRADQVMWYALTDIEQKSTIAAGLVFASSIVGAESALVPELKRIGRKENIPALKKDPQVVRLSEREAGGLGHFHVEAAGEIVARGRLATPNWDGPGKDEVCCPACGEKGSLTEPRLFNLMYHTYNGPIHDDANKVYLRPETAQGIFLDYKNVLDTMRVKVPFGVAQIGKAFRNEVTPRNFIFRSREFEQMEMEWFCHPDESLKWYEFWKAERMKWWESLGISRGNLRFRDHAADELAHYSKACVDVEYLYPFTAPDYGELEGIAHRGCFDLTQHQQHSGRDLSYFDQDLQVRLQNEGVDKEQIRQRSRYIPNVIEPASGLTRAVLVLLCEAYTPDPERPSKVYMKFHPKFAPVKAAVLPLVAKDGMPEIAEKLYNELRERFVVELDVKQNIGKRYARQDEIGTPFCFTIDGQTKEDGTVTTRYRDTLQQDRIPLENVGRFLEEQMAASE